MTRKLEDGTLDPAKAVRGEEVRVLLSSGRSFRARFLETGAGEIEGLDNLFVEVPLEGATREWVPRFIPADDWVGLVEV